LCKIQKIAAIAPNIVNIVRLINHNLSYKRALGKTGQDDMMQDLRFVIEFRHHNATEITI
jgi:hypothetical protein